MYEEQPKGWRDVPAECRYCGTPVEYFGNVCEYCFEQLLPAEKRFFEGRVG